MQDTWERYIKSWIKQIYRSVLPAKSWMTLQSGPRPQWAQEKQSDPPNFGQARRIPFWLEKIWLQKRRKKALKILEQDVNGCEYISGKVSLIVLSCKRLRELKRLCGTLIPFFNDIETYSNVEKIFVDNGSGKELIDYVKDLEFFDRIVAHPDNLGMAGALNQIYQDCQGEYILLVEDDMIIDYDRPYLKKCLNIFDEYPEIGIIRLKNQNNWWKPFRIIGALRSTKAGDDFWVWYPSLNRQMNVWACGSVIFRKKSFLHTGLLPMGEGRQQAILVENVYAKRYNRNWLGAKIKDCYPNYQPNDNEESPGFSDQIL
jgi:hypothetical protein